MELLNNLPHKNIQLPVQKLSAEAPMNNPTANIRLTGGITMEITESVSAVFIWQLIKAVSYALYCKTTTDFNLYSNERRRLGRM